MRPSESQFREWEHRLVRLLDDVEQAFGENAAGTYPNPLEMCIYLALRAAVDGRKTAGQSVV